MTPTPVQIVHQLVDDYALPDDTNWVVVRLCASCLVVFIKHSAVCAEVLGEVWAACLQVAPRLAHGFPAVAA